MAEETAPTKAEIDAAAQLYMDAKKNLQDAKEKLSMFAETLTQMIRDYGFVPPRATKSRRIQGDEWKITLSKGHSVEVDGTLAREIRRSLKLIGCVRYFRKLFRPEIIYVLADGSQRALALMAEAGIPSPEHREIISLYNQAVEIKDNSPSLEVEPLKKKEGKVA